MTSDQLWSVVRKDHIWELEAAIEHENNPSRGAVCYDLAKLADIKARVKILVAYPRREDERQKLLDEIVEILRVKPLKVKEEKYLVIFGRIESGKVYFSAWVFDHQGKRMVLR